jgi:BarA-like signal transduction histidine kinase
MQPYPNPMVVPLLSGTPLRVFFRQLMAVSPAPNGETVLLAGIPFARNDNLDRHDPRLP